jgi:uncharacterized SAM-binding protein YcdF (DUF218 family)
MDLLRKAGVPDESLQMVPSRMMDWDRTYSAAIALRDWIQKRELSVQRINVVTEDTHARRTRLLFPKAFGKDVPVGIIAVANVDYPANQWWHYSEGLKDVVSEFAAYLYARFLFLPLISGQRRALANRVLTGLCLLKPENSDPIAGSRSFGLPSNNFVE